MSAFEDALAEALHSVDHPALADCRLGLHTLVALPNGSIGPPPWRGKRQCVNQAELLAVHPALAPFVTEDRAAERPDALLVTRESLAAAFHEEYRDGDFGCRHHGNQHHASWDCWGHANDIFDALRSGESR